VVDGLDVAIGHVHGKCIEWVLLNDFVDGRVDSITSIDFFL